MIDHTWSPWPHATLIVKNTLERMTKNSPWLTDFQQRLYYESSTRLIDWIDRITVDASPGELAEAGFEIVSNGEDDGVVMRHPKAQLPWIVPAKSVPRALISFKVESIADFAIAHQLDRRHTIEGSPMAPMRRLLVDDADGLEIWATERHGSWSWQPSAAQPIDARLLLERTELIALRVRVGGSLESRFQNLQRDLATIIDEIGVDRTADIFFNCERKYWQSRNKAGQFQKMRQDRLGLGWANHDHHTYRSSRAAFHQLIATLEQLGMVCRERFYAGREAGWGAQVLEQPGTGVVVFADVDLSPDELVQDFAHQPLENRETLGTVGLWCALHGEAIFEAGMHHLECQFDFDAARDQLAAEGIASMKPFTDLPHLRQVFTVGENWPVSEDKLQAALAANWITPQQAEQFRRQGAIGSHLEILQRNDGYKGFNQAGISEIILDTDPRKKN